MFCQVTAFAEFLRINKIDASVFQYFSVEGIVTDGDALVKADFIRLGINFLLRLLIELRRVGKSDKDSVGLIWIVLIPVINCLD